MSSPKDIEIARRRLKAFRFTPQSIEDILRGTIEIVPVLDGRGTVERYAYQWETNSGIVICSHPEFAAIELNGEIPISDPIFKARLIPS